MITQTQILKIKQFAVDIDWNGAFAGASSGNRHLFRTVHKATALAKVLGARVDIVQAGAWLHDTNLELTITGDTLVNKDKVESFLRSIDVCEDDIKQVIHCIEAHDGRVLACSVEAQIVHDADTLEKCGSLGVIRETWKRCQAGWNTEKIAFHLQEHIHMRSQRLYTQQARRTARLLNGDIVLFLSTLQRQLDESRTGSQHDRSCDDEYES